MLVSEFEHRHSEQLPVRWSGSGAYPEMVNSVTRYRDGIEVRMSRDRYQPARPFSRAEQCSYRRRPEAGSSASLAVRLYPVAFGPRRQSDSTRAGRPALHGSDRTRFPPSGARSERSIAAGSRSTTKMTEGMSLLRSGSAAPRVKPSAEAVNRSVELRWDTEILPRNRKFESTSLQRLCAKMAHSQSKHTILSQTSASLAQLCFDLTERHNTREALSRSRLRR